MCLVKARSAGLDIFKKKKKDKHAVCNVEYLCHRRL